MRTSPLRSTVFDIRVPGDLFDNMDDFLDYAIYQAREEADDYVIPAEWTSEHISGDIGDYEIKFRVKRLSNSIYSL